MAEGPAAPTRLSIVVLTFRRVAALEALLPVVATSAREAAGIETEILVVDNDPRASARETVSALDQPGVRYVHEPVPGIAAARQRGLLESAERDVIVFLDDDLVPQPGWLPPLVDMWQQTGAAAVLGHVEYRLVGAIDPLVAAGGFYRRRTHPSGTELTTAASGNLLLDVAQVRSLGVDFSPELGLSGGEDTLFSSQLSAAGGTIVYCAESVVVGELGPDRANRADTEARLRAHAGILVRNRLVLASGRAARAAIRIRAVVGGLARRAVGTAWLVLGSRSDDIATTARGVRLSARGRGMVEAGFGRLLEEYTRDE